jgi:DNA-binding response OmpR family regulator
MMKKKNNNRILLVDNEPDIALAFNIGLKDNGLVVNAFNDLLLALSSISRDCTLWHIDIKTPKMNGFNLYREIRKLDDEVKVCFMTAFDIKTDELNAAIPTLRKKTDLVAGLKAELEG